MIDNAVAELDPVLDTEDGEPLWPYAEDDLMPGGHRAWELLGVGRRC